MYSTRQSAADADRARRAGMRLVLVFTTGAALVSCGNGPSGPSVAERPECEIPAAFADTVLFENVRALSFDDGVVREGVSVLIADGRIIEIGVAIAPPAQATVVPGCGRYLVPGLADMHVHLSRADLADYLSAGVTTVRNLWGFPDLLLMRDEIERGTLLGPSVHVISSGLDGLPEKWPYTQLVLQPADAPRVVEAQARLGYTTLKLYQDLSSGAFDAIVAEAHRLGLGYGGHVPTRVPVTHALASGYRFIEHLSGYEVAVSRAGRVGAFAWTDIVPERIPALVEATVAAGTWNSPTLAIFSQIASGDDRVVGNRRDFVAALHDAGAPLLIGTDSGIGRTAPGASIHQEIAEFLAAGLSPLEVLRIATVDAARFLDATDDFGRVAVGLRADLLLVADNPLTDPGVLRRPAAVVVRGRRVPPVAIVP